jgi:hypothetical protein
VEFSIVSFTFAFPINIACKQLENCLMDFILMLYSKSKELHNLYSSPSIIRIIKLRRMRRVGHVAQMGEKRNVYRLLVGKPEGKRPLGIPSNVGGWITLRWTF